MLMMLLVLIAEIKFGKNNKQLVFAYLCMSSFY